MSCTLWYKICHIKTIKKFSSRRADVKNDGELVSFSSFIVVNIDGRNYVNFGEAQRFLVNFDGELTELTSILTGLSHD